ncbi:MAG: hypothetical protein WAK01_01255 [Methylocystis sp.]
MMIPSLSLVRYGLALSLALVAPSLARADTFTLDTWRNASINGYAITGSFIYDASTKTIVSDSTKISNLCGVSSSCNLTVFSTGASPELEVTHSGITGAPQYLAFFSDLGAAGTFSSLYTAWDFSFSNELTGISGGVNITAAPSPKTGAGAASLIALVCAALWLRRDRLRQQPPR